MKTVEIQCCVAGCGHSPFPMAESFYDRARRTHESWHCPAGHSQHFVGKSEEEKLRDALALAERSKKTLERWWERARDEGRQCPWPTCRSYVYASRSSMYDHMRRAHDMPTVELVEEAS